jgi:hypothetical protein
MKYFLLINFFITITLHSSANKDSTLNINNISIVVYRTWPTSAQLPLNNSYRFIIESNGNAILKWPNSCPPSRNNILVCSFKGKVPPRKFSSLVRFINRIDFVHLNDVYSYGLNEESIDDRGVERFEIQFNNNQYKTIEYERIDIKNLNKLREKMVKIKKSIKWEPVN